ncbi:hypothetical protein AAMO2058_000276500 [Amorphochlora amoebiformis]
MPLSHTTPQTNNLQLQARNGGYSHQYRFRSHTPTLDPLKSLEIEERINMIKFVRGQSSGTYVLTTNDKVIKLWRVQKKRSNAARRLSSSPQRLKNALLAKAGGSPIGSPRLLPRPIGKVPPPSLKRPGVEGGEGKGGGRSLASKQDYQMTSTLKRDYAGAHSYHIHSISINSDNETFISLDSLRVNLWHLQQEAQRYTIIDIKPKDMTGLTEIITSGTFHPTHCHTLMYTTSRGRMCLHDLRSSAVLKEPARNFEIAETAYPTKHFFSEILTSISDAKFTNEGRYVLSRDYLSLKLWDVNMEHKPVQVFPVQTHLSGHLPMLYHNNALFDRFQCAASPDGKQFATGSYSNNTIIQSRKSDAVALGAPPAPSQFSMSKPNPDPKISNPSQFEYSTTKFNEKVLLCAWHPKQNIIACSGTNRLGVYEQKKISYEQDK